MNLLMNYVIRIAKNFVIRITKNFIIKITKAHHGFPSDALLSPKNFMWCGTPLVVIRSICFD